jgi:hypothetical protein
VSMTLLCVWLQWDVVPMLLVLAMLFISGDLHNPFEWSRFAVRMISALLCTTALCLLNVTSYPASYSWPTESSFC